MEDTTKESGKRAKMIRNERAGKETKIRRSNPLEINAGKQPPSRDPAKERLLRWSVSPINSRFLAARGISARIHANARSRTLTLVGGQNRHDEREMNVERRAVGSAEWRLGKEDERGDRRKEKERKRKNKRVVQRNCELNSQPAGAVLSAPANSRRQQCVHFSSSSSSSSL